MRTILLIATGGTIASRPTAAAGIRIAEQLELVRETGCGYHLARAAFLRAGTGGILPH